MKSLSTSRKLLFLIGPLLLLSVALWCVGRARKQYATTFQTIVIPTKWRLGQGVCALAFSPNSQNLAIADSQLRILDWNIETAKFDHQFYSATGIPQSLIWDDNDRILLGSNSSFKMFESPQGSLKHIVSYPPKGKVTRGITAPKYQTEESRLATISPRGNLVAWGDKDGKISVWDLMTGKRQFAIQLSEQVIFGLAFSPDASKLFVASALKDAVHEGSLIPGVEISVREAQTGKLQKNFQWNEAHLSRDLVGTLGLACSSDNKFLAASNMVGVSIWDIQQGKFLRFAKGVSFPRNASPKFIAFSPKTSVFAAFGWGQEIYLWDANTGQLLQKFYGSHFMRALAFSPDGKWLATGGRNAQGEGIVQIRDVSSFVGQTPE